MLLTYVDESYNRELYYIAALLCPDVEAISLTRALDAVVSRAAELHGIAPDTELHGHDIFQAKGPWEHFAKMPRVRIGVYNEAFQAIGEHDIKIIIRGVNSRRLRERYNAADDPHSVVLGQLLERVDEYVSRRDEYALVIADEVAQPGLYRTDLSLYQQRGLWGESSRKLTRIVDTLHFAPSAASRLVQAADLIAFLHRRIETQTAPDERARRANNVLWERVGPRVLSATCWTP
ncbi:DUF3800 domain-containing protein [Micromonospora parva]|uniref:DUF3800 domain-containing protein n=1 Tax=Micromonospora parva TaxID=1464048 RepID=UPI0033C2FE6E